MTGNDPFCIYCFVEESVVRQETNKSMAFWGINSNTQLNDSQVDECSKSQFHDYFNDNPIVALRT